MSTLMTCLSLGLEVRDPTAITHLAEARNQISRIRHFGHAFSAVSFLWGGFLIPGLVYRKGVMGEKRLVNLYQLVTDFIKKCSDDHVGAFGAMAAFFILLSVFPFMIFLLTLTRYLPFSKNDLIIFLTNTLSFESDVMIRQVVNEIYGKAGTTVSTMSIIMALWSSSRGVYAISLGLNSVYDIDENRNYFVLRFVSMIYTAILALLIAMVMVIWIFGNTLYDYFKERFVVLGNILGSMVHKRLIFTIIVMTIVFMLIYQYIPNRRSRFTRQLPGALICSLGWIICSIGTEFYVNNFGSFSYIYGSVAGIMVIILWLYLCMSIVFYGAEINYFLENKKNYHKLVRILRPDWTRQRRRQERQLNREASQNILFRNERISMRAIMNGDQAAAAPKKKKGEKTDHVSPEKKTD